MFSAGNSHAAPVPINYHQVYKQYGNKFDLNKGMNIPIFTCGHWFGDTYARSISFGLSKLFSFSTFSTPQLIQQVCEYMLSVCKEHARQEDHNSIYTDVVYGLGKRTVSVYALSYKHRMFGGPMGRRQRVSNSEMRQMATEIVHHARSSGKEAFCFWMDQILGQRKPKAERSWVNNGLLPYAVFDTIIFPYSSDELGAWLTTEQLLASGRQFSEKRRPGSVLVIRSEKDGGPDSLMRAASALASGSIDSLRGSHEDKCTIVNWALETLDMSSFMRGRQEDHFTRLFYKREPWNKTRLSSVMTNLEILPGEVVRPARQRNTGGVWNQEAELLSLLIPDDIKSLCDGSWLERGNTSVFKTNQNGKLAYVQYIARAARPRLIIAAILSIREDNRIGTVLEFTAASFDELIDASARRILESRSSLEAWKPIKDFFADRGLTLSRLLRQFNGKWV